jgi:hypothetical protein
MWWTMRTWARNLPRVRHALAITAHSALLTNRWSIAWLNQSAVYTTRRRSLESRLRKSLPQTRNLIRSAITTGIGIGTINLPTGTGGLGGLGRNATAEGPKLKNSRVTTNQTLMSGHLGGSEIRGRGKRTVSPKSQTLGVVFDPAQLN